MPVVVNKLLENKCSEYFIINLISIVGSKFSIEDLVNAVEQHNCLSLLLPWLESQVLGGTNEQLVHTTIAKVYINTNNVGLENFITENKFYSSRLVGKYCETRNPELACFIYERGLCDNELISFCETKKMFNVEARYLVNRGSNDLWQRVLSELNIYKKELLSELYLLITKVDNYELVLQTVNAFSSNKSIYELYVLLKQIVLNPTTYSKDKFL